MSFRSWALALATVGAVAVPAAAEAARTTGSVNLRTGPGTIYEVITTLPPGVYVSVSRCTGGWCAVNAAGFSGWISASYIGGAYPRYASAPPPPPPRYYYQPIYPRPYRYAYPYRYYGGPSFYYSGPGYGFYFNYGGHRHW
jgi:uncharacterized protein YraI